MSKKKKENVEKENVDGKKSENADVEQKKYERGKSRKVKVERKMSKSHLSTIFVFSLLTLEEEKILFKIWNKATEQK